MMIMRLRVQVMITYGRALTTKNARIQSRCCRGAYVATGLLTIFS